MTQPQPEALAKAYVPRRVRARDLRALAGGGRLRARRRGLDRRPDLAALRDHPAAAQRDRLPPPGPRPAHRGRGPDDPPRPDASAVRPSSCRASTTPASLPSSCWTASSPRRASPAQIAGPRAVPRADAARSSRRPASVILAQQRRVGGVVRLGPPPVHDGRGLRAGGRECVRAALPRRASPTAPRRSSTGARAAGPASATSRSSRRPRRARSGRSATTWSTTATGRPDPDATITVATTRPETILGDTAVAVHPDDPRYAALVGRRVRIPFVERDVPVIADAVVDPAFGTGAVKITPAHDHDDHATGCATASRCRRSSTTTAHVADTGHGVRRPRPLRGPHGDPRRPRAPVATSRASRPTRWSSAAASAATTSSSRASRPSGSSARRRWRRRRWRPPGSGRTRILPERFEKTWEHWLTNIRDWNVSPPAVVGPSHPGLVLPGRPRHRLAADPTVRPPARPAPVPPRSSRQDPDIFDTWFSSGLWPFSTLGWPDETAGPAPLLPDARSWRRATTSSSSGSPG